MLSKTVVFNDVTRHDVNIVFIPRIILIH